MSKEPKIPKVGDVFIFSYAHTLKFSAKVVKITEKTVAFEYIGRETMKRDNSSVLESSSVWVPDANKKYVVQYGYKESEYKFSARKTSFRSEGDVSVSHHDAYGWPWDGKPVNETHYH